ncbi:MAG: 3-deoxy-8-phosphooctulonate synthase [Fidelibacterota bacterium]
MTVRVGNIEFGGKDLPFIAGPCVIESMDHSLKMAESLQDIFDRVGVPFVFKSSFDKANRTSGRSFRGPGVETGLKILEEVKRTVGVPVLTDIHLPEQAQQVSEVVDILQIPAFLCRQTDLLVAAGQTGKCVNVKKGQFVAPGDVVHIRDKVRSTGNDRILLTERGYSFGYNNLVTDLRSIAVLRETGCPVVFDASHSAQLPGGLGDRTGGQRDIIPILARGAVAAGCDAVFMEVHDDVAQARSDAATQWPLDQTEDLVKVLCDIREIVWESDGGSGGESGS